MPSNCAGANHLRDSEQLKQMLLKQNSEPGSYIAAICAAPAVVLATHGLLYTLPCGIIDLLGLAKWPPVTQIS